MLSKEEYEAKRQARYDRLLAASKKAEADSSALLETSRSMASVIPFGQPILVGHHSEKRDRNYRERIHNKARKGFELYEKAQEYKSRAASVEANDAIYSDDPEATDKLAAKIAELENLQATWKVINAAHAKYKKNPATLDKSDLTDAQKKIVRDYVPDYRWNPHPIAGYQLTNNNANIRRLKQRLAIVEKKQALTDKDYEINGVKIEGRPSENRLRIDFGKRVDREMFMQLRQHGFRATKTEGVFSAYYNNNAIYFCKNVLGLTAEHKS